MNAFVDENGTARKSAWRIWLKRVGIALGFIVLLLAVFHRPLLHSLGRILAIHFAAKENLKLDCRLEGSIFGSLIIRNLHVVPTGPTIVESIDADYIRADYSLLAFLREGASELLEKVELRNVSAVLDPAKASLKPNVPKPDEPITLPTIFPKQIVIADVNVRVRSTDEAHDFFLQHFDLALNPESPGDLQIRTLQIPALPAWHDLAAKTSYTNRKLTLTGLKLDNGNEFRSLVVDASRIREKALGLELESSLAGGTFSGTLALSQTSKSLDTKAHFAAENISLDTLRGYIGRPPEFLGGNMDRLEVDWSGAIDAPRSWDGKVAAQLSNLTKDGMSLDRLTINLTAHNAVATINAAELTKGSNKLSLSGNVTLPNDIREFGRAPASLHLSGQLPDLHALTANLGQPVSGAATIEGRADIVNAKLTAALNLSTGTIDWGGGSAEAVTALITASKQMPAPDSPAVYYADLQTETHLDVTNVESGDYRIDAVKAVVKSSEDLVTVEQAQLVRGLNAVKIGGTYRLPADFSKAQLQPADLQISVDAKELADFWIRDNPLKITGPLMVDGQITSRDGQAAGELTIFGTNLRARELTVAELSASISIWRNAVFINDLTANLGGQNFVRVDGKVGVEKPFRYTGSLSANLADLSKFKPLLAATGNNNDLAGALKLEWSGSGQAANFNNAGEVKLNLDKARYANLNGLQARIDATYAPDGLTIPIIYLGSDKLLFQAVAESNGTTLEITNIQIDQGQAKYATGYISVPFIWKNLASDKPVFDPNGNVAITFQSANLDLKKLFQDLGAEPVGSGLVSVNLEAKGPLTKMDAQLGVQMRDLRSSKLEKFEPASFDLTANLQSDRLAVNGKLQQAKIQPITLTANLPLNIGRILEQKKFDEQTPLTAKVEMPRSSINFVRQFVPALERIDGELGLNVNVAGTVAQPVFSGAAEIKINAARFSNPTLPALTSFNARLNFERDRLDLSEFHGDLAGGPFTLSGRITFPKLTEPNFDLHLKAEAVLVARNDDLTARTDADIQISGPLNSASVTGNIALTNSQFLKNLDLIPIGVPGRPPPAPQPPSDTADLSFPNPPLRDWKFDIAIRTKDPFLIRGNLANGGALVDMKLSGTGLKPELNGSVRLQNVEATLPFSRLEISQGFIYFNPEDPTNPGVDLQGTSLIRDYTVRVYVYGTVNQPQAVFTSEPPLPQEEIISLLATGTTREELASGSNVLAGRALMLLGQQLYQKIFRKGKVTKSNSVFDRLQVDVGGVDPRTGQQTATARYRASDQVQLIGEIGVQGDFRGTVKYLLRFR